MASAGRCTHALSSCSSTARRPGYGRERLAGGDRAQLLDAKRSCWAYLEGAGFKRNVSRPEAAGVRAVPCVLEREPPSDLTELAEWFACFVGHVRDLSEAEASSVWSQFPALWR